MRSAAAASRFRPRAVALAVAIGAGLFVAPAEVGWAGPLAVECEALPGGGWALLVESQGASLSASSRPDGGIQVEVGDAEPSGWELGERTCRHLARTTVVPGSLVGEPTSHVMVSPAKRMGEPRIVEAPGRVRLLWIPVAEAPAVGAAPADASPAPERPSEASEPSRRPERGNAGKAAQEAPQEPAREPSPAKPSPPPRKAEQPPAPRAPDPATAPTLAMPSEPAPRDVGVSQAATSPAAARASAPAPAAAAAAPAPPAAVQRVSPPATLTASLATDVRVGPGRREAVVRRIASGQVVTIDGRSGDWLRLVGGGWVFGPYFDAAAQTAEFMATVSAEKAQVRSGPGGQHDLVAEIFKGESVAIDDVQGNWAHVRNGGWVPLESLTR